MNTDRKNGTFTRISIISPPKTWTGVHSQVTVHIDDAEHSILLDIASDVSACSVPG